MPRSLCLHPVSHQPTPPRTLLSLFVGRTTVPISYPASKVALRSSHWLSLHSVTPSAGRVGEWHRRRVRSIGGPLRSLRSRVAVDLTRAKALRLAGA